MNAIQSGNMWLMELLRGNESRCYIMFRMDKDVFFRLCNDLETNYGLRDSRRMNAIEILEIFLHILGHGVGNRLVQERFQHSGETVTRYFGQVWDVVCRMATDIIKPRDSDFRDIPEEILTDSRYMPHFKDCIGAIDGTHIPVSISPEDQIPYIGRKGIPTQNVMAACDFNMQFIFVVTGWEGTTHDSRIFQKTIRDTALNFPKPPKDAGYPQMSGYLGPYKGERYHIPDFRRGRQPTGPREVFNQAHSSLRSVIECTFGVWKIKWKFVKTMPNFSFNKQVKIVIATLALHNYIKRHVQPDRHF
ncbi:hypothetical protein Dsin_018593 [Dipteronia sinensis]|uniref:DDE Tnp4 domain-containing protein n=1 Tax=Dipteronia sinensis TaxID=43782 RepID=A0AAE0A664_9ROSI|nr:hypothetical protein Dsin_018593 [Dipteronia sinensis]